MAGYAGLPTFGQQVFIGIGGFAEALFHYYGSVSIWAAWPLSGLASLAFAWLLCLPIGGRGGRRRMWLGIGIAILLALGYEAVIAIDPSADVFGSVYVRRIVILLLIFLGALPLLRLRGAYFAIATWLIAQSVSTVFNGWNVAGAGGGMQIKTEVTQLQLHYAALALLAVTTAIIWAWMRSTAGLALTAIRDDEDAAQTCGVDIGVVKATVFLFSAVATGLAAGLYFIDVVIITPPSAFTISWAAYTVFIVVSGGMGTVAGPIVGAVLFIIIEQLLRRYRRAGNVVARRLVDPAHADPATGGNRTRLRFSASATAGGIDTRFARGRDLRHRASRPRTRTAGLQNGTGNMMTAILPSNQEHGP